MEQCGVAVTLFSLCSEGTDLEFNPVTSGDNALVVLMYLD